nr:unnamed protein product [Naegleria fowleri]
MSSISSSSSSLSSLQQHIQVDETSALLKTTPQQPSQQQQQQQPSPTVPSPSLISSHYYSYYPSVTNNRNITTLLDDDHCGHLFVNSHPNHHQHNHHHHSHHHSLTPQLNSFNPNSSNNTILNHGNHTQILLSQVTTIRKWKWSFCLTSTVVIMMLISFSILLLYNLLFSQPYVYINQIQINQLPIVDRTVGFNIILTANNPSILSIEIYSILLNIKLFDSQKSVYYDIETPLSYTFQNLTTIDSLSISQSVSISSKIYIGNNPNFIQLLDLFARNIYIGIEVNGKIGMYVFGGAFYHSQPVKKSQQYLLVGGSSSGR